MAHADFEYLVTAFTRTRIASHIGESSCGRVATLALTFFTIVLPCISASADEKLDAEISRIIAHLKDKDPELRLAAFMAIRGEYGERAHAAVPTLIELLKAAPSEAGHLQVRKALASIGPPAALALLEPLRSDNVEFRNRAAQALWHMSLGPHKPHSAVTGLIGATNDKEKSVRLWAIRALGEIGPESKVVVPAISGALKDEDSSVRREAGLALAQIGPAAKSAVPLLSDQLQDNDISARGSAVFALGRIGPDARAASGDLTQLLDHRILREEASVALGRIGMTESHVSTLIELLNNDHVRSRQLAAINLGRVGADAESAVAALIASIEERPMREFVIHSLGQIGAGAKPAVPELIKLLGDDSYFIRAGAAEALGQIGPAAHESVASLKTTCRDENRLVRRHARIALKRIVNDAP